MASMRKSTDQTFFTHRHYAVCVLSLFRGRALLRQPLPGRDATPSSRDRISRVVVVGFSSSARYVKAGVSCLAARCCKLCAMRFYYDHHTSAILIDIGLRSPKSSSQPPVPKSISSAVSSYVPRAAPCALDVVSRAHAPL